MQALLRVAASEDKEQIQKLMIEVIESSIDERNQADTIENVTKNLQVWHKNPETCLHLVALRKNEIVGVILVKDFCNLCSLFVSARHQRQGIGRKLVVEAIEGCRVKSPNQAIFLNAAPSAVFFYKSLGFVPRESRQELPPGFQPMKLSLVASEA